MFPPPGAPDPTARLPLVGVVLAAGASRRMGRPKALLRTPWGRPLVLAHLEALAAACEALVVVTGAHHGGIAPLVPPGVHLVRNPLWNASGPLASLALALTAIPARAALVTPVDVPPATAGALRRLLATPPPAALGHAGRPGHPLLLGPGGVAAARAHPHHPGGLRRLLPRPAVVPAGPDRLRNLNRPADLEAWLRASRCR